jgi:hypothetical protein
VFDWITLDNLDTVLCSLELLQVVVFVGLGFVLGKETRRR